MSGSMQRYLESKRSVDDRALNRRVLSRFADGLTARARERDGPVRLVEVGAGVGAMVHRLAAWDVLPPRLSYRAVDVDEGSIAYAGERLPEWLADEGYAVERRGDGLLARKESGGVDRRLEISLETADAFAIEGTADAVVACAFLDVVDLEAALSTVAGLLRDGGLLYAPITFDGGTGFVPTHPLDDRIERLYHRHMDELRDEPGSSRAGSRAIARLPDAGFSLLEVGGADWIVHPHGNAYPDDEDVFVDHLLGTIDGALAAYPQSVLEPADRERWIELRRGQLDRCELVFVAHHLDLLARA